MTLGDIEKKLESGIQTFSAQEIALLLNTIRVMKIINRRKGIVG